MLSTTHGNFLSCPSDYHAYLRPILPILSTHRPTLPICLTSHIGLYCISAYAAYRPILPIGLSA